MSHSDCVFCRIIAGELPSFTIAADAAAVAFMDINPANPGHVLVVSREHAPDLLSISPQALAGVAAMAQRVASAVQTVLRPDGLNLLQANGPGAAQSVRHFHMHVLPRRMHDGLPLNWTPTPGDRDAIRDLSARLSAALT